MSTVILLLVPRHLYPGGSKTCFADYLFKLILFKFLGIYISFVLVLTILRNYHHRRRRRRRRRHRHRQKTEVGQLYRLNSDFFISLHTTNNVMTF